MNDNYVKKIINDLNLEDNFLEKRSNGLILRNSEISILERNNIDYKKYNSISDIIYDIEEYLNDCNDNEELEWLSKELSERNYYENTNK